MFYENRHGFPFNTALSLSFCIFAKLHKQRCEPSARCNNREKSLLFSKKLLQIVEESLQMIEPAGAELTAVCESLILSSNNSKLKIIQKKI